MALPALVGQGPGCSLHIPQLLLLLQALGKGLEFSGHFGRGANPRETLTRVSRQRVPSSLLMAAGVPAPVAQDGAPQSGRRGCRCAQLRTAQSPPPGLPRRAPSPVASPGLRRSTPPPGSGPQSPSLTGPMGSCTSKAQPGHGEDAKLGHLNARKDPRTTRSDSQCPNTVKYDETGNPAPRREATRVKGLLPSPFCLSSGSLTCPARGGHAGFQ